MTTDPNAYRLFANALKYAQGTLSATIDGSGNLIIADTDATGKNNSLTASVSGSNLVITDANEQFASAPAGGTLSNGNKTLTIPFSAIAGPQVIINTNVGTDTLTENFAGGNFLKQIVFNGGGNVDSLFFQNGSFTTSTYNYTNSTDGSVTHGTNSTIYTGLSPITSTINAVNVILNYSTTAETIGVAAGGAGQTTVTSTAGETTTFTNPTGSLTINAGDTGGDTINVNGLGSGFNANLTIDGETGNDIVNLAGAVNLGAGNLNVTAETINSNATVTTTGAAVLNANSGAITDGNGSSVNIAAASLVATATAGINLDTTVANLEASGGSGGVTINETDGLIIGGISAVNGVSATGGSISVVASGTITVNEPVSNTGGGSVSVNGQGAGGGAYSMSTPAFNLQDIGGTGTFISLSDDVVSGAIPLGFTFNYFGANYTNIYIGSNGFITVLPGQSQGCCSGQPLPQNDSTNGTISPYWNDIYPPGAGGVYYQTQGAPGNREFIVQYRDVANCCNGTPAHNFEIKLFETTGIIEFHYLYSNNDGSTGSAGIEDPTGTIGVQYFIGTADIPDNTAVRFTPGGAAADVVINASISSIGGNGTVTVLAGQDILHNSGTVSAAGNGTVTETAGRHVTMGATAQVQSNLGSIAITADNAAGNNGGAITMADGSLVNTNALASLAADGNIQVSHVQSSSAAGNAVMVTTTSGAITDADGGAALDISAVNGGAILSAATGIGAAGSNATIEVQVINLDLNNSTSGGIFVTDTAGGLTLAALSGPESVSGVGGGGLITALSPLTIASDATTSGGMTYTATDSAGAGDNLTINAGVTVTDTTASLTFNAGDNFKLFDTAAISAATTATINIDAGNADAGGATADINGALAAASGAFLNGDTESDIFNITGPTVGALDGITAAVTVNGMGGTNNLNLSDANDGSGDTAAITHTTVEGLGGSAGTDYTYSNIANLDVTAGSAADSLTTSLGGAVASPTDFNGLVTVAVHGNGGADNLFLHVADSLTNATLDFVRLFGDADGDNFGGAAPADHIHPVLATGQTQIIINGDANAKTTAPVNPGTDPVLTSPDHLFLDMTTTDSGATVNPIVIVDTNGGYADAANTQSFRYNGIEDIDLYDNGVLTNTAIGDFFLRATNNPDYILFVSAAQVNPVFRIRVGNLYYPTSGGNYGPYTTGSSNVFVLGQGGNDTISMYNTRLNAAFFGGDGDDILTGGYGNDLLVGGKGNDRLNGASVGGNDEIWGDDFNPATDNPAVASQAATVPGQDNDQINTYGGNDTVYGQGGNDTINTGNGADYINGGFGKDLIDGQAGNDRIYGGGDNDVLSGSDGNDVVAGNDGNDTLYGRTGNDILIGGIGQDIVNGNEGGDALVGDESNNGGSKSLSKGDAIDLALAALLLDWASPTPTTGNFASKLVSTSGFGSSGPDGSVDTLWGGTEADAFFGLGPLLDQAPDRGAPGYSPDLN